MAKVLVVGGAGYVGGWLIDERVEAGHEVRVYDLLLYEDRYLKEVDVRRRRRARPRARCARISSGPTRWSGSRRSSATPPARSTPRSPARSTSSRSNGSVASFDGRIVFPSTCSVYGAQERELDEDSPTDAAVAVRRDQGRDCERVLMRARPDSLILRLATLAGMGDTYSRIRLDLVVNLLVMRAKMIGELQVFGGEQYRPLLHVRDVATRRSSPISSHRRRRHLQPRHRERDRSSRWPSGSSSGSARARSSASRRPFQDTRNYRVSFERAKAELGFEPRVHDRRRDRRDRRADRRPAA